MSTTSIPQCSASRFPNSDDAANPAEIVIQPQSGWIAIDWKEMFEYRELLTFLIWRDISVRYKQTVLGSAWAILHPLMLMLIFTFFFGRFVSVHSEGFPYPVFVFAGVDPLDAVLAGVRAGRAEPGQPTALADQGVLPAAVRADRRPHRYSWSTWLIPW